MLLPVTRAKTEMIEVIRITNPARHLTSKDLVGDSVEIWVEDQARRALDLITGLPGDEKYRCFVPGWGVRAHSFTEQLFEIAFCFSCHAARLWGPDVPLEQQHQTFDAESPAARELLAWFRACLTEGEAPGDSGVDEVQRLPQVVLGDAGHERPVGEVPVEQP